MVIVVVLCHLTVESEISDKKVKAKSQGPKDQGSTLPKREAGTSSRDSRVLNLALPLSAKPFIQGHRPGCEPPKGLGQSSLQPAVKDISNPYVTSQRICPRSRDTQRKRNLGPLRDDDSAIVREGVRRHINA